MENIEKLVKLAFLEIYFNRGNYLEKMHCHLLAQIKSYAKDIEIINDTEYIKINNELFEIPKLPESFKNRKTMFDFINGIINSPYFIN